MTLEQLHMAPMADLQAIVLGHAPAHHLLRMVCDKEIERRKADAHYNPLKTRK